MEKEYTQETNGVISRNCRRKTWKKIVSVLGCIVVFWTTYALILPALTMENTSYCGLEAHQHCDECYEKMLICGQEECEALVHVHSEECYIHQEKLICGQDGSTDVHTHSESCIVYEQKLACENEDIEHEHTEECYETAESYICGLEEGEPIEHVHTDECCSTEEVLICGLEEGEEIPGHKHTDECYESIFICEKEEHIHNLSCYSNPEADVESPEVWERSVSAVELTGDWRVDLIAVAESQFGYTESSRNYVVDEMGTMKGYTRYGAWYGIPYGDWCAMFVSFCLDYAGVPAEAFPREASCQRWIEALKSEEYALYRDRADYTPKKGDVIFFDWDGDQIADHVGLVAECVENSQGILTELKTIEGNAGDQVKYGTYSIEDGSILAYGALPEAPESTEPAASQTVEAAPVIPEEAGSMQVVPETVGASVMSAGENGAPLQLPVTEVSGEGTVYHPETDQFTTNLKIGFTLEKSDVQSGADYVFTYPKEVMVPGGLIGVEKDLYDGNNKKVGTYTFEANPDGTATVHVHIDDSYVADAGETITGSVQFEGTLNASPGEDGGIKITIGGGDLDIDIPPEEITYPGDETNKYDIEVGKSGSFVKDGDKLIYTVYVRSTKGTPDPIQFNDVITAEGLTLGTPNIKVEQGTYQNNSQYYRPDNNDFTTVNVSPVCSNGSISMSLPGLAAGTEENGVIRAHCYRITYTYDLSGQKITKLSPKNDVTVKAEDETTKQTVTDQDTVTVNIDKVPKLEKGGSYNAGTGRIEWTVTVNQNQVDIAGAVLTDDMLGQISEGSNISIEPAEGWEKITGADGKPAFKFTGTTNTNKYVIKYETDAQPGWNDQKVRNNAELDPDPDKPDDEIPKEDTVTVPGVDMQKRGSYKAETGRIEWTITIRTNGMNIAGAKLTDEILAKLSGVTGVTVEPSFGCVLKKDANGKITGIEFTEDSANTDQYVIKYYTEAQSGWNDQLITNIAVLEPPPDIPGDDITDTETVPIPGGSVEKSCGGLTPSADKKTGTISWTVTLHVPESGLPAGTVIKDDVATGRSGSSKDQWLSYDQIIAWGTSMTWASGGTETPDPAYVTFLGSNSATYTYRQLQNAAADSVEVGLRYTMFRISFPNGLATPTGKEDKLSFTYETTVDLEKAKPGSTKYYNYVEVGDKNANAETAYHKGGVVKTDGNGQTGESYTNSDGSLTWRVRVTLDEQPNKSLTVIDTLPDGVVLDGITVSGETSMALELAENGIISGGNSGYTVSGSYLSDGKVALTLKPSDANGTLKSKGEFIFTFRCHADSDKLDGLVPGKTYDFKNSVTAATDNAALGSSEQTQHWKYDVPEEKKEVVEKTGSWDNDNRLLNYSVLINQEGKDLIEDSDTLTLIDKLKYDSLVHYDNNQKEATLEISLIKSSVKLYYAVQDESGNWGKGALVEGLTWEYDTEKNTSDTYHLPITNILVAEGLPDSTPLILEYTYAAASSIPKGNTVNLSVNNTATLKGTTYSGSSGGGGVAWEDQSSTGTVTTKKAFTIYKVDESNYNKVLEGAEFSVYRFDPASGGYESEPVTTRATLADGTLKIQWEDSCYAYNTLYMVKETKAPDKYKLPETVKEFYFYFSNETDTEHTLPASLPESAVDLSRKADEELVGNVSDTVNVTVEKKWTDYNGSPTAHNNGSVTLNLYQISSDKPGGTAALTGIIKIGDFTNGSEWLSFDDSYPAGTRLSFSITNKTANNRPILSLNGVSLLPDKEETITTIIDHGSWKETDNDYVYTYSFELSGGKNVLSGNTSTWTAGDWEWSGLTVTKPAAPDPSGEPYRTAKITVQDNWRYVFRELPKSEVKEDGSIVYYSYYISEVPVENYTTSYENNEGITGGTITVTNKADKVPGHEMPKTGGSDAVLYTAGGLISLCAGLLLLVQKRKRRKEDFASS